MKSLPRKETFLKCFMKYKKQKLCLLLLMMCKTKGIVNSSLLLLNRLKSSVLTEE